jgi:DNA-binding response OmpR family regulator
LIQKIYSLFWHDNCKTVVVDFAQDEFSLAKRIQMKRILVIDDDIALLELIQRWLENANYEAIVATTGKVGLERHRKTPADLIITDIYLPDRNGTGLFMEIRDEFPQTKVMIMSGGGGVSRIDYLEFARLLGATKVFRKPFERQEFMNIVQSVF